MFLNLSREICSQCSTGANGGIGNSDFGGSMENQTKNQLISSHDGRCWPFQMFVARSTPPTFRVPGWIMSWLRVRKGCLPTGSLKLMQHARRRDTILLNPDEMRLIHSWSSSGAFDGFAILDSSRHTPLWWHVAHTHTPTCGGFAGTYLVRIDMARYIGT